MDPGAAEQLTIKSKYDPLKLWSAGSWNGTDMLCQERPIYLGSPTIWSDRFYPHGSDSSTFILLFCLILLIITLTSFILKPIGLPAMAKMFGGFFIIGLLYSKNALGFQTLVPPTVYYFMNSFSQIGFIFYTFIFGVELNLLALIKKVRKKAIIICFSGYFTSLALGYSGLKALNIKEDEAGYLRQMILNAQTFFMVTCSHVNDLGISNSEIGRLACAISLVIDVYGMFSTFLIFNVYLPFKDGNFVLPFYVIAVYLFMFFICRPLILVIISYTPEGRRMKDSHFLAIIVIILVLTILSLLVGQPLLVFLFAVFLPEEPLTSILNERLDLMNSSIFLPVFCAMHGFIADFNHLGKKSLIIEFIVFLSISGKFLGTVISSRLFGVPFWSAVSLGIILCSGGFLDIVMLGIFRHSGVMEPEHYTVIGIHILFCTCAFLPLVRFMYNPSRQYSTILRQGVIASAETGTLQVLACIHKEENLPGILRLLESFNPTHETPLPVIALQLIQLTGRVTQPILAPFHEIQSSAAFRSNIGRCNRIISSLLSLERRTDGAARLQHYISVSAYATMHNDICSLAHEKKTSLLILPFHVQWTADREVEHFSEAIRDVNKMVFEKAPCSAGLLVDRGDKDVTILDVEYRVAIFFIGGADDHEALAYATLFARHPSIRLTVVWLKSKMSESNTHSFDDYAVIQEFHHKLQGNERMSLQEIVVSDGAETTNAVIAFKNEIDLAVVGRYHEPGCTPLFGLTDRWCEYPELGILGDMLVTPEFNFSVLVVQEEPHKTTENDDLIDDFVM
ncbi:cation/H(+) antiporter 14-like [Chenopodium quinoa]|nr:cation/H(+) antiporter 14-like [Chenopodium quinoa]